MTTSTTEQAATTAFTIAASKAAAMAAEEEKTIKQLRDAIVLTQMKKIQLKMAYLEGLEKNVLEEKAELEKQRMVLFLERVNLKKAMMGMGVDDNNNSNASGYNRISSHASSIDSNSEILRIGDNNSMRN